MKIINILLLVISTTLLLSQSVEKMPFACDNLPYSEKNVVAVTDFDNAASGSWRVGQGMSDMLTNALVESGCFRVVERDRLSSVLGEQDLGNSGRVNPATAAQIGNLTGAQLLVMGSITEFEEKVSGGAIGGFSRKIGIGGVGKTKAHIGMVVQIVSANTGEILMSKSINHKRTKVGAIGGTSVLGVTAGALFFKSKAMEEVVEEAIIEAAGIIVAQRNSLPPPSTISASLFVIQISNVDFKGYNNVRKMLEGLNNVAVVSKSFKDRLAIYNLELGIDAETLADKLMTNGGISLEITGFDETRIEANAN